MNKTTRYKQKNASALPSVSHAGFLRKGAIRDSISGNHERKQHNAESFHPEPNFGGTKSMDNRTGLPDLLKGGLESVSGFDLSGIRVHKNSPEPRRVNALAYTQGQNIYVGPGQEKHIPHEGWHVVQQMQGRVRPMAHIKGMLINNDSSLENEADVMGAKALQLKSAEHPTKNQQDLVSGVMTERQLIQRRPNKGKKQTQTMDFSDDPVAIVGHRVDISSGGPAVEALNIETLHGRLVTDLGRNANAAIKMFTDFMSFAADEEASASGANAAFTFVRKALINHYLGKALNPLVQMVPAVGQLTGLAEALLAESARAQKAAGEVKIRNYLVDLSTSWNEKIDKLSKGLDGLGDSIEKQYSNIAKPLGGEDELRTISLTKDGRTVITGPGAEFLSKLKKQATNARQSQPAAGDLFRQMVVRYAKSNEGAIVGLGGGEVKQSGKIYLSGRIYLNGNSISLYPPSVGRLLAPSAAKTASAFNRIMSSQGWSIHNLPLEKIMEVKIENETSWSNDYYTAHFNWTTPTSLERSSIIASLHNDEYPKVSKKIRDQVMLAWKTTRFGTKSIAKLASV